MMLKRLPGRARSIPSVAACLLPLLLVACGDGGGDTVSASDRGGQIGEVPAQPVENVPGTAVPPPPARSGPDPLLAQQWHLDANPGGLRAVTAWAASKGQGVRVNVVDDAVEITHEDLAPNVLIGAGWNYITGTRSPLPSGAQDAHGTPVAGIVAARDDNAVGGAGVAPRAGIAGYNALATNTSADMLDALASGFDVTGVSNNSWGSRDDGALHRVDARHAAALRNGVTVGRQGRGIVYVFPAGNGGTQDNSNYDGYVNRFGALTVCGTAESGGIATYSEPGANVLVCGPGGGRASPSEPLKGIVTTAINNSYRPLNGSGVFFGTSAAVPSVSGAVALMLSARPDLTWRDVRLILADTARRTSLTHSANSEGTDPWHPFNSAYGFGIVDAEAAVARAQGWNSVGGSESLRECFVASGAAGFPITLPDADVSQAPGAMQSHSLAVAANCGGGISQIEFIEIGFDASGGYSGDLHVELVSPAGARSILARPRVCETTDGATVSCGTYSGWIFGSTRHLNEAATGTWTLQVTDGQWRNISTWNNWNLRIWGR